MTLDDWRPFGVVALPPDERGFVDYTVRGRSGDDTWTIYKTNVHADAVMVCNALNNHGDAQPDPLSRPQLETFLQTLYLGDGRRLAPVGVWLAARIRAFPSSLYAPQSQRDALAADLRRLADGVETPPDKEPEPS